MTVGGAATIQTMPWWGTLCIGGCTVACLSSLYINRKAPRAQAFAGLLGDLILIPFAAGYWLKAILVALGKAHLPILNLGLALFAIVQRRTLTTRRRQRETG